MTDNLRDRIAAALFRQRGHSHNWDDETESCREMWRNDADAVIRDLGLRQETVGLIHRHVTEWTTGNA
jgi:hypothetical protein